MSARRTERLLNLVICLLATSRWLTKEQIRAAVPQYTEGESAEAFDRMFERDKDDLRDLGIPVLTGRISAGFDDEIGYRIDREAYALPPLDLSPDERAAVALAGRVWQQAGLAGPAARALAKLDAFEAGSEAGDVAGLEPRIRTAEAAFDPLYAAVRDRQVVSFTYRKPSGESARRTVEPWTVLSRSGRWYLVGRDRDRAAPRVFRLSRIEGDVRRTGRTAAFVPPDDVDPRHLLDGPPETTDDRPAVVRLRQGKGAALRRRSLGGSTAVADGWDEVSLGIGDLGGLAEELSSYGPDVLVITPTDLRDAVAERLRAALAAQAGGAP